MLRSLEKKQRPLTYHFTISRLCHNNCAHSLFFERNNIMKKTTFALAFALCGLIQSHACAVDRDMPKISHHGAQKRRGACSGFLSAFCCAGIVQYTRDCCKSSGSDEATPRKSYFSRRSLNCCRKKTKGE